MKDKSPQICAIIPARFGSTRLLGKPLLDFHGKPMVQWVYETAIKVYDHVAIATDDDRIVHAVERFGGLSVMTNTEHKNGTSRCLEAYIKLGWSADYIVNIQGDEPMIDQQCLHDLNATLMNQQADISTLIASVTDEKELFGASEVFVVRTKQDYALYFSRAIIPFFHRIPQDQWLEHGKYFKHVGLYAFKPEVLRNLVDLKPSYLEKAEDLEQNRWIENGYRIKTGLTETTSYPVDTPNDIQLVRDLMAKGLNLKK